MLAMPLIFIICAANFVLGFVLAVQMGHGPIDYGLPPALRNRLPAFLRPRRTPNQHAHPPATH